MDKKRIDDVDTTKDLEVKEKPKKEKKVKVKKEKVKKEKTKVNGLYLGYFTRVVLFGLLFALLFSTSYFLVKNSFSYKDARVVNYQDSGTIDYKVYLKPNEFYEQPFLGKNMVYVAGLINTVNIDFNYQFLLDEMTDMNFNYTVMGKLQISDDSGANVYYSKNYVLLNSKQDKVEKQNVYNLKESVSVDYEKYNDLANKFKSSYGIDAASNFIVTLKVNKSVNDLNLNESNEMSVTIPLSQRAISIKSDASAMNNNRSITSESSVSLDNKVFIGLAVISFIASVACLLKFLELVVAYFGKKSAYDSYLDKIFKQYDRLIVETKTMPRFDDKNIIKIQRFEELLDARDTLKQPIMYFNISDHNKCYFYISVRNDVYLTVVKAVDLEAKKNEKKKRK